jgi:hypothetical protein
MEGINDLIWIPESDDDFCINDFGGGEGEMEPFCMVNSCQNQGAVNNAYCKYENDPITLCQ